MIQLAYTSIASKPMSKIELLKLLQSARVFNSLNGVTGVLLYKDQSFFQVIEGQKKIMTNLLDNIIKDPRHFNLKVLYERETMRRDFGMWSMGFANYEINDTDFESWVDGSFEFPLQNVSGNFSELVNIANAKKLVVKFARMAV